MINATVRYVNDMGKQELIITVPLPQSVPPLEAVQLSDLMQAYIAHYDEFVEAWRQGLYPTPGDVPWDALFPQASPPEAPAVKWPEHTQENMSL